MNILILDNYDSFTFNLVQYIQELLGRKVDVYRNDAISLADINAYDTIVLSPGPGLPENAGIMPDLIRQYAPTKAILGVCLGHQAIGQAFGADLENMSKVYHGVETPVEVIDKSEVLFDGVAERFQAGRYHSWVIDKKTLPDSLEITAVDDLGEIMAVKHVEYNVRGVQFHPESIMTTEGKKILGNFLQKCAHFQTIETE